MYSAKITVPYSDTLFKSFSAEDKKTERFEYSLKKNKKELKEIKEQKEKVNAIMEY